MKDKKVKKIVQSENVKNHISESVLQMLKSKKFRDGLLTAIKECIDGKAPVVRGGYQQQVDEIVRQRVSFATKHEGVWQDMTAKEVWLRLGVENTSVVSVGKALSKLGAARTLKNGYMSYAITGIVDSIKTTKEKKKDKIDWC